MKKYKKYAIITIVGGLYYFLLEVLWRGYSHWTMIMTGGACVLFLYLINDKLSSVPFLARCALGSLIITAAELAVGLVVNVWLGWDVWDYSDKSFNIMGQICLNSSLIWFLLCIPGFAASRIVKEIFAAAEGESNDGKKIPKTESKGYN